LDVEVAIGGKMSILKGPVSCHSHVERNDFMAHSLWLKRLLTWVFLTFASVSVAAVSLPESLRFRHIMTEPENTIGNVMAFAQDAHGFMWIGGGNGLAKYDGYDYTFYVHDADNKNTLSANSVNDIAINQKGELWIATEDGLNRYDYEQDKFVRYQHEAANANSLSSNTIYRLHIDKNDQLWLATKEGINRYEPKTDTIARFENPQLNTQFMLDLTDDGEGNFYIAHGFGIKVWNTKTGTIKEFQRYPGSNALNISRSIMRDREGRIWVGTDAGLMQFLPETGNYLFFPSNIDNATATDNVSVWDIMQDQDGILWVATDGQGLGFLDKQTQRIKSFVHNDRDPSSLSSNIIRRVFADQAGDIWAGAYPFGISIFSRYTAAFNIYADTTGDNRSLSHRYVRALAEDSQGNLLIGTDGGGLNIRHPDTGLHRVLKHNPKDAQSISSNEVLTIMEDQQKNLWLGSWNSGISVCNPVTEKCKFYTAEFNHTSRLRSQHIWKILQTKQGQIWVGTIGGDLSLYNPDTDGFKTFRYEQGVEGGLASEQVWALEEDSWGDLWIGTQGGLSRYYSDTGKIVNYVKDDKNPKSLKSNRILAIFEDSKKRLWIGSQEAGLTQFHRNNNEFISIRKKDGLISDQVVGILEDNQGLIWVSSSKGISSFDPVTGKINSYTKAQGIQSGEFNIGAALKASNGDLIFGGIEGYTRFNPLNIQNDNYAPKLVFTRLEVVNREVNINDSSTLLNKSLLLSKQLTFDYTQSVISLGFSGISFRNTQDITYEYILEGFDKQWRNVGRERKATYTNLDGGEYLFKVQATTSAGTKSNVASIAIKVLPPPWKTWWAYVIYLTLIASVLFYYIKNKNKIIRSEREVVAKLQKIDRLKDEFLANTSHELRTPLFGIIGLAESLLDASSSRLSKMDINHLAMIIASGKRMTAIVEDVQDFSLIRHNALKIKKIPVDVKVVSGIVSALTQPLLAYDKVKIINNILPELPPAYADEDRLQQIFHNLLGNAAKFTAQGEITIDAKIKDKCIVVSIADTGPGIPKDRFDDIFESFTQLEQSDSRTHDGVGLGLAITKNLVNLQGGEIWLESELGVGTTFYFSIPLYLGETQTDVVKVSKRIIRRLEANGANTDTVDLFDERTTIKDAKISVKSARILIVDDEPVNRRVLRNQLAAANISVVDVIDGLQAINLLKKGEKFDLVLMDVMMPHLSGYDVCKKIREQYSRQSLPIIFITAKNQLQDMISGFEAGGNDFLTKPFSRSELLVRIDIHLQLLESHRDLENKIQQRTGELQEAYRKLEALSLSDPLTGLGNRRFFEKFITADTQKIERAYRNAIDSHVPFDFEQDLIFMLVDLDHFKQVNDTYGHAAGDQVLIHVSHALKEASRKADYIVRWGGEEFMVVARGLSREKAQHLASRIRESVASLDIKVGEKNIKVTCSVGYAAYPLCTHSPECYTPEMVIKVADVALYAAKNSGRNAWIGVIEALNVDYDCFKTAEALQRNALKIASSIKDLSRIQWNK
jgi:two-component system, sensor histidine kinase ChiS